MSQPTTFQVIAESPHATNEEILINQETNKNRHGTSTISQWAGRAIAGVEEGVELGFNAMTYTVQSILTGLTELTADTNALAAFFRKIDKHILKMVEELKNVPGFFEKLQGQLKSTIGFIDFAQIVGRINYFANCKFKEDSRLKIIGETSLIFADFGGALLWLEEIGFFNLTKAAQSIGETRIFSFVPKAISTIPVIRDVSKLQMLGTAIGEVRIFSALKKISLGMVAERALTLAYVFFAADAFQRLLQPGNFSQKTHAGLELASYLAELALDAMLVIGVTSVVGLGVMGSACLVLAFSSFIYKIVHEKEIKQPFKLESLNGNV